jgi:hypothetical protein
MPDMTPIPEDRSLTAEEAKLVRWLLEHGTSEAVDFLPQLNKARVVSRCPCGCPSIDFAIDGREPPREAGIHVLSDYYWDDSAGHGYGVFVFARGGLLAGLEVWWVDGFGDECKLPAIEDLKPLPTQ